MQKIPQAYELYRHFSGKLYQVLTLAKDARSGEMLVIYQALHGDYQIYAGDYSWFTEMYAPAIPQTEPLTVESVTTVNKASEPYDANTDEIQLDPLLIEFLDSDTYEAKLNILSALHHRITDDMLTTMAVSCDVEVDEGDVEERYASLRSCLLTLEKYECNRLRNR
jgi:hypothetical protein